MNTAVSVTVEKQIIQLFTIIGWLNHDQVLNVVFAYIFIFIFFCKMKQIHVWTWKKQLHDKLVRGITYFLNITSFFKCIDKLSCCCFGYILQAF